MNVSQLIDALNSPQTDKRAAAAEQLALAGEASQAAAISLVRAAGDSDEDVSNWCVAALESLGPPLDADQVPLTKLLAQPQELTAYWAATLLGRLGTQAESSCQALAQAAVEHTRLAVRQRAVWALGKTESSSHATMQALRQSARSTDARLSRLAKQALEQVAMP